MEITPIYHLTTADKYRLAKLVERREQINREIADIYMKAACHYEIHDSTGEMINRLIESGMFKKIEPMELLNNFNGDVLKDLEGADK